MHELSVPRSNTGFPSICILTGKTEDVKLVDLVLKRRNAAVCSALAGLLLLGWLGALLAAHYIPEKCPARLPVSRRGYRRWSRARGIMVAIYAGSIVATWFFAEIVRGRMGDWSNPSWRLKAWLLLTGAVVIPAVAYRILLWTQQPWLRQSRGLLVDLWIPSEAAATAIRDHMKPLTARIRSGMAKAAQHPDGHQTLAQ
jgi:hypothetical protein